MHFGIFEMYYALLNGVLEHLNAECLPLCFKHDQADGELLLELLLFIQGDGINLSLQLVTDPLQISETPGHGFCRRIGSPYLKLQLLVGGHVCHPVSLISGLRIHNGK